LGTPPINCFDGCIKDGSLYIGEEKLFALSGIEDKEVTVAIRPEGFSLDEDDEKLFTCGLERIEVMGRDVSIVATHEKCASSVIRAIVDADNLAFVNGSTVKFGLKRHKVFIFEKENGERIRF
jgi:multiple sugar transport system ATP-binding protein